MKAIHPIWVIGLFLTACNSFAQSFNCPGSTKQVSLGDSPTTVMAQCGQKTLQPIATSKKTITTWTYTIHFQQGTSQHAKQTALPLTLIIHFHHNHMLDYQVHTIHAADKPPASLSMLKQLLPSGASSTTIRQAFGPPETIKTHHQSKASKQVLSYTHKQQKHRFIFEAGQLVKVEPTGTAHP
jgi:hypothetical protein